MSELGALGLGRNTGSALFTAGKVLPELASARAEMALSLSASPHYCSFAIISSHSFQQ